MKGFSAPVMIQNRCPYVSGYLRCEMRNDLLCNCRVKTIVENAQLVGFRFECPWWSATWREGEKL